MQKLRFSQYFKTIMISVDVIVFALVFIVFYLKTSFSQITDDFTETNLLSIIVLILFWLLLSGRTHIYNFSRTVTYTGYLERLITHIALFIFGIFLLAKIIKTPLINDNKYAITSVLFVSLFIIKSIVFFLLKIIRSQGWNYRNAIFLGRSSASEILKDRISKRKDYGYKIFEINEAKISKIDDLKTFWKQNGIHTIFMTEDYFHNNFDDTEVLKEAELNKIRVNIIPKFSNHKFFSHEINYIEAFPLLTPFRFPLQYYGNYIIKRFFDIIFSLCFLLFIGLWLFPIIAVLIKLDSKGSVFFIQKRYGYNDKVFNCLKFRTMKINCNSETKTTDKNDKRITRIGRFLRKTSLDETPQFINVLLGDMSVVGPRPHMLMVDDVFKPVISQYSIRSLVNPGITGLAQVNGFRGDSGEMRFEMKKRVLSDSYYVKNWSFVLDLVIILKTLVLLIKGDKNAR